MRKISLLLFTVGMFTGILNAQVDQAARRSRTDAPVMHKKDIEAEQIKNKLGLSRSNPSNRIATPCPGATNVPYTENFDGVTAPAIPDCITIENTNGGNSWGTVDSDDTVSSPNIMRLDYELDGVTPADDWFFMRGLNLTAGTSYRLTFQYRNSDATSFIEKLEVKYGPAANSLSMTAGTLFSNTHIDFNRWREGGIDFTPSSTGVFYVGFHGFSDANEARLAIDNVKVDATPVCPPPIGVTITNLTATTATVNFTPAGSNYVIEYGPDGFIPGQDQNPGVGGTAIGVFSTDIPFTLTGLTPLTKYNVYVRQFCGGTSYGPNSTIVTFTTPITNDEAPGAISIVLDAGCSGNAYSNLGSTQGATEPFASCSGTAGFHTVWYKFVAPVGGAVKVSTDFAGSGLNDSRIAVFAATNVNDYSTFTILGCDDDNGVTGPLMSIVYLVGLTPGTTYYIQVDGKNSSTTPGSFCLEVATLNSGMLAGTAICGGSQGFTDLNPTYTGWISLVDNNGNLIANVKQTAGTATAVSGGITINTAALRKDVVAPTARQYLDRNYLISAAGTSSADVQFFFLNSELATLQAADPSVTLGNLGATRQTGSSCQADFVPLNGTNSYLTQTSNGTINGLSWIRVTTTGLSNFYLHTSKAPITLKAFLQGAYNVGLVRHKDVTAAWASALNANALNQPYSSAPFNYPGTESVSPGFFTSTAATTDILDWVLLELRSSPPPAAAVATRAAFIREDGSIVDVDGLSSVSFRGIPNGSYFITIRHRNHLGIRTATVQIMDGSLGAGLTPSVYDLSSGQSKAFQDVAITTNAAMKDLGSGVFGMWAGNVNANNTVRFTGVGNDLGALLAALGGNQALVLNARYDRADLNMDGTIRFTGVGNDLGVMLSALGGNQAAIFTQHQ